MRNPSSKEKRSVGVGEILGREMDAREKVPGVVEGHKDHGRSAEDVDTSKTGSGNPCRAFLQGQNGTDSNLEVRNRPIDLDFRLNNLHSALRYLKAVEREEDR